MVSRPVTWIPLGRTRATTTSRFVAPISMPTPEPNITSLRRSFEMGSSVVMPGSIAPGAKSRVVPAQNVNRGIESGRHVLHLRRHRALQVRKLAVRGTHPRRRAHQNDRIALQP